MKLIMKIRGIYMFANNLGEATVVSIKCCVCVLTAVVSINAMVVC